MYYICTYYMHINIFIHIIYDPSLYIHLTYTLYTYIMYILYLVCIEIDGR